MADLKVSQLADWASEFKVACSCGRGNISLYVCNVQDCPDKDQNLFCYECIIEDEKHPHKKVSIKNELQKRLSDWQSLTESAKELKNIIDAYYSKHKALIKYFDNENLLK